MILVLLCVLGIDQDIIREYQHIFIQLLDEYVRHQTIKGSECICQSKRNDIKFVVVIPCVKSYLWYIFLLNPDLIISKFEINLCVDARIVKSIQQFIYSGDGILVFDSALIQSPIVNAHSKGAILLFDKQDRGALR